MLNIIGITSAVIFSGAISLSFSNLQVYYIQNRIDTTKIEEMKILNRVIASQPLWCIGRNKTVSSTRVLILIILALIGFIQLAVCKDFISSNFLTSLICSVIILITLIYDYKPLMVYFESRQLLNELNEDY